MVTLPQPPLFSPPHHHHHEQSLEVTFKARKLQLLGRVVLSAITRIQRLRGHRKIQRRMQCGLGAGAPAQDACVYHWVLSSAPPRSPFLCSQRGLPSDCSKSPEPSHPHREEQYWDSKQRRVGDLTSISLSSRTWLSLPVVLGHRATRISLDFCTFNWDLCGHGPFLFPSLRLALTFGCSFSIQRGEKLPASRG